MLRIPGSGLPVTATPQKGAGVRIHFLSKEGMDLEGVSVSRKNGWEGEREAETLKETRLFCLRIRRKEMKEM